MSDEFPTDEMRERGLDEARVAEVADRFVGQDGDTTVVDEEDAE